MPSSLRRQKQRERKSRADRYRGSARERGYTPAWDKASKAHLREHPLCRYCELDGRVTAAQCVDHLYPHRGDTKLFWLKVLWVSSCNDCHTGFKQSIERQGMAAIDALARRLGLPTLSEYLAG